MPLWIGTSGFSYPEWKGKFYPADLTQKKFFAFYAERFRTVEINATFYKFPTEAAVKGWADESPAGFVFALKAPQRITHKARLVGCEADHDAFLARARLLGEKLGAVLFQMPPFFKNSPPNLETVSAFAQRCPKDVRCAFELRSDTWHDETVYARFRDAGVALCVSDSEKLHTPFVATAPFTYLRLRDEGYGEKDLEGWLAKIEEAKLQQAYVYFKHEDEARGPDLAVRLRALADRAA